MPGMGLRVEVRFESTAAGGRSTPVNLAADYRTLASTGTHASFDISREHFGISLTEGPSSVLPGETATAVLAPPVYPPAIEKLLAAGTFTIFEGQRVVAHGHVIGAVDAAV